MAHTQKPDLVFQRNRQVHLNRWGCQVSRLLAVEECRSADSDCIDRVPTYSARLLATHSIRIFPLHFPSHASPCAIRFRTRYTCFTLCAHRVTVFISFLNSLSNKKIPWKTGIYIWSEREIAILVSETYEEQTFYKKIM